MDLKTWLKDTAERVASTTAQAAMVLVIATVSVTPRLDTTVLKALVASLLPGAFNVIKSALTTWVPKWQRAWQDIAWRTVSTFGVTFAGVATAAGMNLLNAPAWRSAAIAGFTAALAIIKGALVKNQPGTITPASVAVPPAPTPAV